VLVSTRRLLFVCVENSCRSQMAEAFARMDGGAGVEAHSAGSRASGVVNPGAVRAMAELGYDLDTHRSKAPADLPGDHRFDVVVSMGCGDACPTVPADRREDWDVPDPKAMDEAGFRAVRDEIRARVRALLASLQTAS
jgi:arsenate reductase